jgi:hypothetical protein
MDASYHLPTRFGDRVLRLSAEIAKVETLIARHQNTLVELRAKRDALCP